MIRAQTLFFGFTLALFATTSSAQMYRCVNGGSSYYSDRPCMSAAPKVDKFGSLGPVTETSSSSSSYRESSSRYYREPSQERAPDYQKYLSGTCASMLDAIRTAPSRGLKYDVIRDLRNEYEQKCYEEDRMARRKQYEESGEESRQKAGTYVAADKAKQELARLQTQCNAMRDVLASKRRQLDTMKPGDRANFDTLEKSFNDRCIRVQ